MKDLFQGGLSFQQAFMKLGGLDRLSQSHPMKQSFQALNELNVVGVGISADKVLLNAFQSEKQPWDIFELLPVKVLQVLENIAPNRISVNTGFLSVKARHRERADLEFVHYRGIKFQIRVVNQHQVPAQRLQMAVSDHKSVIVLTYCQALVGMQDDRQIGFLFAFDQTELRALVF